nr:immunoglobulin heavy chain junction region [Mus musculus]MBK4187613.1 immunoglobulin heavy chain junction region [Mus musculus]MBK4187615.1 immunoglobulin heavy chain junction region [Mus musculus]MBK4187616.1 immunoglobulin heavy chain junction region [Mus musculus]
TVQEEEFITTVAQYGTLTT